MIVNPKKFYGGLGLLILFTVVLVLIFLPLIDGKNALSFLDSLFNSISKDSAYYIPTLKEKVAELEDPDTSLSIETESAEQAGETAVLFRRAGAKVTVEGIRLSVEGDLKKILTVCLEDTDDLFANDRDKLPARYGTPPRKTILNWWVALKSTDADLKRQRKFAQASVVSAVTTKGVECAYNYYGIKPTPISERIGIVVLSLLFYVGYTILYGISIMMLFEGLGFKLSH